MNDDMAGTAACYSRKPSIIARLRSKLRSAITASRVRRLYALLEKLEGDSYLVSHGRTELRKGLAQPADDPDRWMADHLIRMLQLFSLEGHSGFSASYARQAFSTLADFQPLGPLTGEDDEWQEVDDKGLRQNIRCGRVFKDPDGQAYDIDGRVFREPNGCCYTSKESRVTVTFPYVPTTEYIDVPEPAGEAA